MPKLPKVIQRAALSLAIASYNTEADAEAHGKQLFHSTNFFRLIYWELSKKIQFSFDVRQRENCEKEMLIFTILTANRY